MNKAELLAYIATLVAQLTELNIEFTPAETKGTNAELEQEIERLESLLPDETEGEIEDEPAATETQNEAAQATEQAPEKTLENSKSEDKALKEDAAKVEQTTRRVFIFRGVNIETIKDGSKVVLQGDNSHTVNADLARSIVAENHGRYEAAEADEV